MDKSIEKTSETENCLPWLKDGISMTIDYYQCGQHEKANRWSSFVHYLLKSLALSPCNCFTQKKSF